MIQLERALAAVRVESIEECAKVADEWARNPGMVARPEGMAVSIRDCIRALLSQRVAAIEECAKVAERFASEHHLAGDFAGEKSFRRCVKQLRALAKRGEGG